MNFNHIYQGWKNLSFPKKEMKEFLQTLEDERLSHCKTCVHGTPDISLTSTCKHCGCFLRAKARCLDCSCPIGKWKAIATAEQHEEIQTVLNK